MLRFVRHPLLFLFLMASTVGSLAGAEPAEVSALRAKAEKGNALAQYNLGLAYAQGQGVPADLPEAFVWLSLASENGSTGKALDSVLGNITDEQLAEGRHRLAEYRAALAARISTTPALGRNPARKPATRGFSLTAPAAAPASAPASETPLTRAPAAIAASEPTRPDDLPGDELAHLRAENAELKAELARAQELLRDQAATMARYSQEHAGQNLPVARNASPRTTPADGTPAAPSTP